MEWLILLIPVFTVFVIKHFFDHAITWYEMVAPVLVAAIIIFIGKLIGNSWITTDYERWGNYLVTVEYYEDWNELIVTYVPKYDSEGNFDGMERVETVVYHPPYWLGIDNTNAFHYISNNDYASIKSRWKNELFQNLHRNYHTDDGDMYLSKWPNTDGSFVKYFHLKRYENRTQLETSTYKYDMPESIDHLISYPDKITEFENDPAILGSDKYKSGDQLLQTYNAKYGSELQIRFWLLIFHNQPLSTAYDQIAYWQGPNKNEFITCLSLDDDENVQWCQSFYWSPNGYSGNDTMALEIKDAISDKPFDEIKTANLLLSEALDHWQRISFDEFNYIHVPTPTWAVLTALFLSIISTIGLSIWAIFNELESDLQLLKSDVIRWLNIFDGHIES